MWVCVCVCTTCLNLQLEKKYIKHNAEARSQNHCCRGKAKTITYFCVHVHKHVGKCMQVGGWEGEGVGISMGVFAHVPLLIQHAMHMRHIVCSHSGSTVFFDIISETAWFSKKVLEHKISFFFSITFIETFLILRTIQRDTAINVKMSSHKVHIILDRLYWNLNFLDRFSKKLKHQISSKSVQWEPSCPIQMDRQSDKLTDMTKLTVAFHSFANVPKMSIIFQHTKLGLVFIMETGCVYCKVETEFLNSI
jgi:hypothetical protein